MKNFLLTICVFFISTPLWAQKATQQDLQGNWKLITYMVPGASLDVATGKVTLSESTTPIAASMSAKLKADMESYTEMLQLSTLEIKGNNFYRVFYDVVNNGTFTIIDKKEYQIMSTNFDDGTSAEIPFQIKEGKLYTTNLDKSKMYIYIRQ